MVTSHVQQISHLSGERYYTCDFTIEPNDKPLFYHVEWKLHNGSVGTRVLYSATETRGDDDQFINATKLLTSHLRDINVTQMGYTVSDAVDIRNYKLRRLRQYDKC